MLARVHEHAHRKYLDETDRNNPQMVQATQADAGLSGIGYLPPGPKIAPICSWQASESLAAPHLHVNKPRCQSILHRYSLPSSVGLLARCLSLALFVCVSFCGFPHSLSFILSLSLSLSRRRAVFFRYGCGQDKFCGVKPEAANRTAQSLKCRVANPRPFSSKSQTLNVKAEPCEL